MAWHVPALPFGGWMGHSVLNSTTAGGGRPVGADQAVSAAPGEGDLSQEVPDEATEPISAWLDTPQFIHPAPSRLIRAEQCARS
jgi:hypothetical protein